MSKTKKRITKPPVNPETQAWIERGMKVMAEPLTKYMNPYSPLRRWYPPR